jgi:hypothetical protein
MVANQFLLAFFQIVICAQTKIKIFAPKSIFKIEKRSLYTKQGKAVF